MAAAWELLVGGASIGAAAVIFAWLAWAMAKTELQQYTDEQVREAKQELREYARENGGVDR